MPSYVVGPRGVTVPGRSFALEPGTVLEVEDGDETWGPHIDAMLAAGQLVLPQGDQPEVERPVVASYVVTARGFTVPGGANVSLAPGTVLEVREGDPLYEGFDFAAAVAAGYLAEPGAATVAQSPQAMPGMIPVSEFNSRNAQARKRRRGKGIAALTDDLPPESFGDD